MRRFASWDHILHSKDSNARFSRFVEPAWGSPQIVRVIVVLLGTELIFQIVGIFGQSLSQSDANGDSAIATIATFGIFAIILILFHLLARFIHQRGVETMIGPANETWRDYKRSMAFVGLVTIAITFAPPFIYKSDLAFVRDLPTWLFWILPAVIVITIQAGTEEVIYRGYLQQQVAVYLPYKVAWMGIPSLLFGLGHYWNGIGPAEGVFFVIWATFLGLACSDLTNRTGNIGAAIGMHTVNNLYATLYIGMEGWPASGLALFVYPYVDPSEYDYSMGTLLTPIAIFEIIIALLVMLIMWLAARIAIRR